MSRFRFRSSVMTLALCLGATGLLASCTDEPMPRGDQSPEERALGALAGRRHNPFRADDVPNAPDSTGEWQGTFYMGGHFLILAGTHVPPGKVVNELYMFGYSPLAKQYYMITVTDGGSGAGPDKVDVSWFTIVGREWRFLPSAITADGKQVVAGRIWDSRSHTTKLVPAVEDSVPAQGPRPRQELAVLAGWAGRWPDTHEESTASVNGVVDAKMVGGGHFLAWFENNVVKDKTTGKQASERLVSLWGFHDVNHLYYRIDIGTSRDGQAFTPWFRAAHLFRPFDDGLVLSAPLQQNRVGNRTIASRYVVTLRSRDTLSVYQQNLADGITWQDVPGAASKWPRLR